MSSPARADFVGAGSYRCESCGYTLALASDEDARVCPGCGGTRFTRASLFGAEQTAPGFEDARSGATAIGLEAAEHDEQLDIRLLQARARIAQPGEYLCFEESNELRTVALTREWTRIGRSMAADVRFDDPTVSRRHALIVRQPDAVRLLDDRSLNGVFVNGARIDGRALADGDEIVIGRYRLRFFSLAAGEPAA